MDAAEDFDPDSEELFAVSDEGVGDDHEREPQAATQAETDEAPEREPRQSVGQVTIQDLIDAGGSEVEAALWRFAAERGYQADDPLWIAASILRAGRLDLDESAAALRSILSDHVADEEARASALIAAARAEIGGEIASRAGEIKAAGILVARAVKETEARAASALDTAAAARGEEISQRWATAAAQAITERVRAQVGRMHALSFAVTAAVLLGFTLLGGAVALGGAEVMHRLAPAQIVHCATDRGTHYCVLKN